MSIPPIFRDNTTIIPNHSLIAYLPCILLRISLGIAIIQKLIPRKWIISGCLLVIALFTFKYLTVPLPVWKVYLRTILTYTIVCGLMIYGTYQDNQDNHNNLWLASGILIIIDALLG